MILVQSSIEGTSYQIKPLAGQPFEKTLLCPLEDLKITSTVADFAKFPLGTVFSVESPEFPEPTHLHLPKGSSDAIFYNDTVYPLSGMDTAKIKTVCDYVVDYMLASNDYGIDKAKAFTKQCESYGYIIDWDAKISIPQPEEGKVGGFIGMRKSIAASYPPPKVDECGFQVDADKWYLMVRNVLRGENTMLIGPTGSGKTEIISHLAKAMSKELNIQDMGTVQDAQSALLGVHRLNKDGHSAFDYAPFIGHIKAGGIVLLDELNRAPLAANNILFPALDKRRYIPVDIACDGAERKIDVNPETVFFATANLGAEYSGTQAIDRALMDRFMPIELDYPAEKEEVRVLMIRTGIDEKAAKAIVKVSNEIRKQFKDQELSNTVSVRHTLQTASLVSDGFETDKSLIAVMMPLFEDGIGVSERSKVLSIMSAF